ncbi:methyltransferase type 11 [Archaeoglobales archaeon]|nr:MAG: methyltransferase type 11 [Archaeoglobales archaeon]
MIEAKKETYIKEQIKQYWDSRGKDYDKSPGHASLPELWKDVLSNVFNSEMKILDVGTGTGFLALLLAELGHEVVGIDLSKGMLEVAIKKARKSKLEIEFKIADAENLPFSNESFDAVICRHLLWILPNPQKAVKEWKRVIKPKGRVVAIDGSWFDKSLKSNIKRFLGRIGVAIYEKRNLWRNYHHLQKIGEMLPFYNNLTPEKAVKLFENAGLLNVSVRDLGWIRKAMLEKQLFVYRFAWSNKAYFMVEGFKGFKDFKEV